MDLRTPTGAFFVILGLIVAVTPPSGAPLTTVNVNLYAGSVMAIFGGTLLWLAKRHS